MGAQHTKKTDLKTFELKYIQEEGKEHAKFLSIYL